VFSFKQKKEGVMKKYLIFSLAVLFGTALFMGATPTQAADQTFVTIGTGG
jgi:TRAP-type uncharacterized transport system substrate-binding protein